MSVAPDQKVTHVTIINAGNPKLPFQRKVRFSEKKRTEVERDFQVLYSDWKSHVADLHTQIAQWKNDAEGIFTGTDEQTPWLDSSKIVKPVIETRINIIHAFWMSIMRPRMGRQFVCPVDDKTNSAEVEAAKDMELFFNSNHQFNKMYVDSSDEAFWAVLGDGTVGRTATWMKVVEKRWEAKVYLTTDDFIAEFSNSETSGVGAEKFQEIMSSLSQGQPVALDVEKEVTTIDRPDIDMENLKDIVVYPMTVSRQERARLVGRRFYLRKSEMKARESLGVYDHVDSVVKSSPPAKWDTVDQTQNSIDGITEPEKNEDYELVHGRYSVDLDDDGIEEKYLVTYAVDAKKFIQFDKYPFYHNEDFLKISWFKRRPKRIVGRGVSQMLSDTQLEGSIRARQRIDSMSITNVPVMLANESLKSALDPRRKSNRIRPGTYLWIPETKMDKALVPVQFPKREFGESQAEEANLNQSADNLLGASELRSGRETPNDPRAPAAKTAILLQQSTMRLDDFIFGFIQKENEVLDIAKKLYYQFGPEKLRFTVDSQNEKGENEVLKKEISRSWFGSDNIHLQLAVTSLMDNPDFLRQKWEEFYAKFGPEPMLGGIPDVRWEMLHQIVLNMPEARGKRILLTLNEISQKLPPTPQPTPGGGNGSQPGVNPTLSNALGGLT